MKFSIAQTAVIVVLAVVMAVFLTNQLSRKSHPQTALVEASDSNETSDDNSASFEHEALAEHLAAASKQREVVAKLEACGYSITYDYLSTPHSAAAPGVQRLVNRFGPDFVGKPFYIGNSGPVSNVALLPQLPSLQNIDFDESDILDEDLLHLKGMPNLKVLFLNNTSISSNGLSQLADTPIEVLHLKNCPVDDSCVPYLSRMKSLKKLYIYKQISPAATSQLKLALPNCDVE